MFIYLDESYNLKDRSKKQFISINGFMTSDVSRIRKKWLRARKPYIKRKRIHAHDSRFKSLRPKALKIINTNQAYLLSAFQNINELPYQHSKKYFTKNKLNFEKIYTDLAKHLLLLINLSKYSKVIITIDSRKNKNSLVGKNKLINTIEKELKNKYSKINIEKPRLIPSTSDALLELADFISNTLYKSYINNKNNINKLCDKIIQTKNPLN